MVLFSLTQIPIWHSCSLGLALIDFSSSVAGFGAVSSNRKELRYQSFHKLQIWDDVLGCSGINLLH